MSAGGNIEKCEPNLTPLLDMVLQLVMFFMLCANFVMEQVNESVKLPEAIAAKALDKSIDNYIILNVMADAESNQPITTIGKGEEFRGQIQLQNYMKNQYDLDKAKTKPADWEKGKGRSLIILRADIGDSTKGRKGCTFKQVHDVMTACRRAGYSDIQLRAIKSAAGD